MLGIKMMERMGMSQATTATTAGPAPKRVSTPERRRPDITFLVSLRPIGFYFSRNPQNLWIGRAGTEWSASPDSSRSKNFMSNFCSCPLETYNTRQPYFPLISYHCMQKSMMNNVRVSKIIRFRLRISNNV
jgi:hypothetical protein